MLTKANVSILLYPAVIVATPLLEPLSLSGFLETVLLFLFLLHLLIILPQSPLLTASTLGLPLAGHDSMGNARIKY